MERLSLDQLLTQAKLHIKNGELKNASEIYESLLKSIADEDKRPQPSGTVKTLTENSAKEPPFGLIERLTELFNRGEMLNVFQEATSLLQKYPGNYFIWNLKGASATEIGQLDQAVSSFLKVIEINPYYLQAYNNLGTAYAKIEELDLAIEAYENALGINPNYIEALNNLGQILVKKGDLENAIIRYRKAVSLKPDFVDAFYNLGNAFKKVGDSEQAIKAWREALSLNSHFIDAYLALGIELAEKGEYSEATRYFKKVISLNPEDAKSYNNLGFVLKEQGDLQEAMSYFKHAISLQPGYVEAISNLGVVYKEQRKFDDAMAQYKQAISIDPSFADAHNNLGDLYREQGFYDEALLSLRAAISFEPTSARAYNNLGATYKNLGRFDEAIEAFKSAIKIEPNFADSYHNLGRLYWLMQNFKQAFELMEWRWLVKSKFIGQQFESVKPIWNGEHGSQVFVWKEQGIGDQLMFSSMLPELVEKSESVYVECDRRLIPIYERSFSKNIKFISDRNEISGLDYDHHIAIGSLPKELRKNLQDFTNASRGWLEADPQKTCTLRNKLLSNETGRVIGISWFTKSTLTEAKKRDLPLGDLMESLKQVPAKFVSLQYGDTSEELRAVSDQLGVEIVRVSEMDLFKDIDGLAALISACDVVISIDNTTVHLAGALGVDTRVLLSSVAEERWGTSGSDSYWYDTLTLYRRKSQGAWKDQLDQLVNDLNNL